MASMRPVVDADGVRRTARAFLADIDRRRHAEAALLANEQRFRDFAQSSSDWIWETDARYRFTFATVPQAESDVERLFYGTLIGRTRWKRSLPTSAPSPGRAISPTWKRDCRSATSATRCP